MRVKIISGCRVYAFLCCDFEFVTVIFILHIFIKSRLISKYFDTSRACKKGGLAQLVERLLCMQKVTGSIPVTSNLFCCTRVTSRTVPPRHGIFYGTFWNICLIALQTCQNPNSLLIFTEDTALENRNDLISKVCYQLDVFCSAQIDNSLFIIQRWRLDETFQTSTPLPA